MQREFRIRKNGHFQYIYRRGRGACTARMSLRYVKAGRVQVGFSVSKKVGNAVVRNRVKRRMRECFRLLLPLLKRGHYVFSARPEAATASYWELESDMKQLLERMKLNREIW